MKIIQTFIALLFITSSVVAQDTITGAKAADHVGKNVTLCDRVNYGKFLNVNKKGPTILYVGPDYPNQYLTLYFPKRSVRRFSFDPEKKMINKRFCVTGKVTSYENKPAIYVRNESQLNVEQENSFIFDFDEKQQQ